MLLICELDFRSVLIDRVVVSKCCRRRLVQLQSHNYVSSYVAKVSYKLTTLFLIVTDAHNRNQRSFILAHMLYLFSETDTSIINVLLGLKFAWITIFLFDFLVFVLTLMRTYRLIKAHAGLQMKSSLAMLVVRDGKLILPWWFIIHAHASSIRQLLLLVRNSHAS